MFSSSTLRYVSSDFDRMNGLASSAIGGGGDNMRGDSGVGGSYQL